MNRTIELINDDDFDRALTAFVETLADEDKKDDSSHTPGPWHVADEIFVIGPDGHSIFGGASTHHTDDECEANARLIAAAPELLDALKTLTDHAQETYPHFESARGQRDIAAARAAIAKAQGE